MKRLERLEQEIKDIKEHLGINHFVDDNKKVAVYAPEAWQKEIVARLWGLKVPNPIGMFKYTIQSLANPKYIGNILKANNEEFKSIDFQDFCKQHGHDGRPDYVWHRDIIYPVCRVRRDLFIIKVIGEGHISAKGKRPATQKEYDEQNPKNEKGQFAEIISNSEEPEAQIPIHDSWNISVEPKEEGDESYEMGYRDGVKEFVQSFYNEACERYKNLHGCYPDFKSLHHFERGALEHAGEMLIKGKLKRQNNDNSK